MALDRYQVHADIPILNLLCVLFVLKTKKGCLLNILKSLFNGLTLAVAALKGRIGNKVPRFFLARSYASYAKARTAMRYARLSRSLPVGVTAKSTVANEGEGSVKDTNMKRTMARRRPMPNTSLSRMST